MKLLLDQPCSLFHLEHTLRCGQVFRWEKLDGWWHGVVREQVVKIRQVRDGLEFQVFPEKNGGEFIANYFRLDDDLPFILSKIGRDQHIRRAIELFRGLRITRQDPWECLISYICATYKNIPAIKNMLRNLTKEFGKKMEVDNQHFYTFPQPHNLAEATLEELERCKLGYRAQYVLETSRIIRDRQFNLEDLRNTDYEKAKPKLLRLPGVGEKVADCVLLFSLDKLEAFPVDVWIKRAILEAYHSHLESPFIEKISGKKSITPSEYRKISSFGREYFGEYAGYAQEYLYHYELFGRRRHARKD